MDEKTQGKKLEALGVGIAKSGEEVAGLAAGLKKPEKWKAFNSSVEGEISLEKPGNGGDPNAGWAGFREKLDEAGVQGGKVARGIADEIKGQCGCIWLRICDRQAAVQKKQQGFLAWKTGNWRW
jgi:hypothetical protein